MTYYLLSSSVNDTVSAAPSRVDTTVGAPDSDATPARGRSASIDSSVTENTIDYDVIPRGTIFLLNCRVSANESLSNMQQKLFAFTIYPPNNTEVRVHLAARSVEARDAWIRRIASVCESISASQLDSSGLTNRNGQLNTPVNVRSGEATVPTTVEPEWQSVDQATDLYAGISDNLKIRVQKELRDSLRLCALEFPDETEWKKLYGRADGSSAYQRLNTAQPMIVASAKFNHPVKQVFNLLVDPNRRKDYDGNIRHCERLRVQSPHTFYDYYSYNAVWPSSPREFAVLVHWQIVQRGNEKAIAVIAFSCEEAGSVKPIENGHVRGTLFVNLSLLRQIDGDLCHITRVLSYSLGGGIPLTLSNFILTQQAGLPRVVGDYLARYEPTPSSQLKGKLVRDQIIKDIIQLIGTQAAELSMRRQNAEDDEDMSLVVSGTSNTNGWKSVSLVKQGSLLILPLIIYDVAQRVEVIYPALWFLVGMLVVIRRLVLLILAGDRSSRFCKEPLIDRTHCRFKVDLKGVLRFLANKKEERKPTGSSDVSVVHIVARACAVALEKQQLHTKHVSIPFLFIDQYVPCSKEHVSVSMVLEQDSYPVTVDRVNEKSVQEIADCAETARRNERKGSKPLGECLVLASHNFDDSDIEVDAVALDRGVNVVAVIGSVGLDRNPSRFMGRGGMGSPRPILQLSLTITSSTGTTFSGARRLAEEIQKLLIYPEICEDGGSV